jgi:CRISPR system Cascade subunit CasA
MSRGSFSLLDEPWVPCQLLDGGTAEFSLHEVFDRLGEVRRLTGELPTTEFALVRLLLAVLYGALPGFRSAEDWAALRDGGLPLGTIHDYLERYRDRFDLLHPETPFFQVAGLHTQRGEFSGLEKLILDVPNGRPFLTTRLGSGLESIGLAEAARWLVAAQAFDPSGIKSGAVGDDRVKGGKGYPLGRGWAGYLGGVFIEGVHLGETLLFNLVGSDAASGAEWNGDAPSWHRPAPGPGATPGTAPTGPASLYTWPSRRIRLEREGDRVTGVLIGYGDPLTPQNQHLREPMTRWRRSQNQEKKLGLQTVYMPREHDPERALWRGIASFVPTPPATKSGGEANLAPLLDDWLAELRSEGVLRSRRVRLRAVGVQYGSNDSVVDEIVDDALALDVLVLATSSTAVANLLDGTQKRTDDAARALAELAGNLALAEGLDEKPARDAAFTQAYAAFDQPYRDWLASLDVTGDLDAADDAWRESVRRLVLASGDELLRGVSRAAWRGREAKGRQINAPLADLWFRAKLHNITRPVREKEEMTQ